MVGKRVLILAMTTGVLLLVFALVSTSGVLADLITYDFTGKVAGSTVENPHLAYTLAAATPDESPATILAQAAEFSQADYDGVEMDDNSYASLGATTTWVEVGSGSASGGGIGTGYNRSMALDGSGNPYVAWDGGGGIYIKRFDGSSWVEVGSGSASGGGISDTGRDVYSLSLALDTSGNPYVAWAQATTGMPEIYIKRFDGSSWMEVGSGSATGGGISDNSGQSYEPSLALDASGNPYVAWRDTASGYYGVIYIKRFDGASWVEVRSGSATGGGISDTSAYSYFPSLSLDASGNPYVAWAVHDSGKYEIWIKRFDGASWVEVGSGSATGGGISGDSGDSRHPSLALDASGHPYVAWDDYISGEIYIKRFDGASWVEVGSGSASGGGISHSSGESSDPSLALDASGHPYVAWWDGTSGDYEIYVKRFNGASWVEVGSGSASGGGISDNSGASYSPSLALDASGNPYVAWDDGRSGNWKIYVKRFLNHYPEHLYEFQLLDVAIDQLTPSVWAYGAAEAGKGVTVKIWNNATWSWDLVGTNTENSMPSAPITASLITNPDNYVDASDKVYLLVRATNPSTESTPATLYVDYIKLDVNYPDLTPPIGSMAINGGDEYTNSTSGTLSVSASDASGISQMRFSNDGTSWSTWEAYATSKAWTLASGDGTKTVYVEYRDNPGNISDSVSDTIILDTTPPNSRVGPLSLYHISLSFSVSWGGSDALSGLATYDVQYRDGGGSWTNLLTGTTLTSTSFTGQDGHTYCFQSRARDILGNLEAYPGGDGDACTIVDVTAPSGAIIINEGALYTTSTDVLLSLSVSGATQMRFSNNGTSYSGWESYAASKTWSLSGGDGEKTVYVQYKDEAGNTSVYTDTIALDTSVPSYYGVSINNGALFTNQITVTLSLGAPAYMAEMMVSNDGGFSGAEWEPYATHREWQITQYGDYVIQRTVYVKYKNTEGTVSSTYQDDIILDVNPPTGSVTIVPGVGSSAPAMSSGGMSSTSNYPYKIFLPLVFKGYPPPTPKFTLLLSAADDVSGVGYMLISNDASFAGAAWEPYATSKEWQVNETGTTTVYVKYKDNAGNISEVYSDTIEL